MKLYVKYMVSNRCKLFVKTELEKLGLHPYSVELGEINVTEDLTAAQRKQLDTALSKSGLELMDDKKSKLIEKIKNIIIEMVHYSDQFPKTNFSDFLSAQLNQDYNHLANLFSEATGTTVEHYIISHKIERAKEYLLYDELTLTEISYLLNYSSVAHLSNQFKRVTGLTPTYFKQLKLHKHRIALENL